MKKLCSVVFFVLMFCLAFCGCGKDSTPDGMLKLKLDALKSGNYETIKIPDGDEKESTTSEAEKEQQQTIYKSLYGNMKYEITNTVIDGDKAKVSVSITTIDMKSIFGKYFAEAFAHLDEENWDSDGAVLSKLITDKDATSVTLKADVTMTKNDSDWCIDEKNDDFYNALTGGLYSFDLTDDENETDDSSTIDVSDVASWAVGDIWNEGFCDIGYYMEDGTSSTGEKLDIDFTINNLKKAYLKKAEYDKYINGLTDSKYDDLKYSWSKLSPEIDNLYQQVTKNEIKPSSGKLDTDLFSQYLNAFSDAADEFYFD